MATGSSDGRTVPAACQRTGGCGLALLSSDAHSLSRSAQILRAPLALPALDASRRRVSS
jgi:hypothetical protein